MMSLFDDRTAWRATFSGIPLVLIVLFLAQTAAEAQIFGGKGLFNRKTEAPRTQTPDEIGIPTPVTGRVEALKGTEVTFEIRADTKTPAAAVEFLIRTFPSAGKIVSMTSNPNRRNRAIVTYYADPDSSADKDAFAFAVRYRGGRYSSAMRFDIDLTDTRAEIQVKKEVDFGSAMIGDSVDREIVVRNLGNGLFERQLFLSPPWFLRNPEDGRLNLGPRESRVIEVSFRPQMIGETSYFLSLSRSQSGTTKLMGTGLDPFSVVTPEVELAINPESLIRSGEIVLANGDDRPLLVQANGSARLQQSLEKEYILIPEGETRIPLKLGRTDTAPFDGMVQFSLQNGYTKTVQVVSAVVPGRLEITIPDSLSSEVINFGKVEAGRSTERGFTISNPGGVAVPLEFHLPEPFRMLNDPGLQLAPLASVNVAVGLFPSVGQKGMVDVTMNVMGNEQVLPIRLLGNVLKSERGNSSVVSGPAPSEQRGLPWKGLRMRTGAEAGEAGASKPSLSLSDEEIPLQGGSDGPGNSGADWLDELNTPGADEKVSPMGFYTESLIARKRNLQLGRPEDLSIVEKDSGSLTIGWTAPKNSEFARFEVELSALHAGEGIFPRTFWVPYSDVTFERIGRLVKAKIDGLSPASTYEFRVLTLDEENRSSEPSEALAVSTDLPMDWTYIYLGLGFVALIALGFGIRKIYLDRRPDVYQAKYADT
ncbi:MAG: fibronectin type III domain-containing protein [Verrucomicrobiota bacterium]